MIVKNNDGEILNCEINLGSIHVWNENNDYHIDIDSGEFEEEFEIIDE